MESLPERLLLYTDHAVHPDDAVHSDDAVGGTMQAMQLKEVGRHHSAEFCRSGANEAEVLTSQREAVPVPGNRREKHEQLVLAIAASRTSHAREHHMQAAPQFRPDGSMISYDPESSPDAEIRIVATKLTEIAQAAEARAAAEAAARVDALAAEIPAGLIAGASGEPVLACLLAACPHLDCLDCAVASKLIL